MKNKKKKLLLALVGLNPQIITEALYCFNMKYDTEIENLYVITTEECLQGIERDLFRELDSYRKHYDLAKPEFDKSDILFPKSTGEIESQELFTDLVYKVVSKFTEYVNYDIYALISGGRKTMSADLFGAMMIFGRDGDKIFHVMASREFEKTGKYFPATENEANELVLIEKNYIRLRDKLGFDNDIAKPVDQLIAEAQNKIDETISLHDLIIRKSERSLQIGDVKIYLQPLQFAIYLFFARKKDFVRGGKRITMTNSKEIKKLYRSCATSQGQADRVFQTSFHNDIIDFDVVQKVISQTSRTIRKNMGNIPIAEHYVITSKGSYADKKYGIRLPRKKVKILK